MMNIRVKNLPTIVNNEWDGWRDLVIPFVDRYGHITEIKTCRDRSFNGSDWPQNTVWYTDEEHSQEELLSIYMDYLQEAEYTC